MKKQIFFCIVAIVFSVVSSANFAFAKNSKPAIEIKKFQITSDGHQENAPAIFKNWVVYADWGDPGRETGIDINLYNLKTGQDEALFSKLGIQSNPDIWKQTVVWNDNNGSDYDVYGMSIKDRKEFPIAVLAGSDQVGPVIYGHIVIWQDNRNGNYDIYGYNLKTKKEFQITDDLLNNYTPRIWEDKVVWYTKIYGGYYNVEGYDLIKEEKFNISSKNNGYQSSPDIFKDKVVWVDSENGNQIYFKNLKTGKGKILTADNDIRDTPRISNQYVAWVEDDGVNAHNIYTYDLDKNIIAQVSDDGPQQPSPTIPDIWQDTIVWMSWHTGNGDIYGSGPDITPPPPPTLNSVVSPTQNSTQTISGIKEADTSVWLNGNKIIPLDSLTAWSYNISLVSGSNNFSITAKDASSNESAAATATIIYNPPSPPAPVSQGNGGGGSSDGSNGGGGGGGGGGDDEDDEDETPSLKTTPQVAGASTLNSERIKSLYQKIFSRIPKTAELSYWVNAKGYSLNEIKKSFYNSNEYNKKIKDLANKQGKKKGIKKLFQDIFGRPIKKNDLTFWSKQNASILGIKFLFLNSKEYKANSEDKQSTERRNQIASLYRNILMRPPDQAGLNYWDKTKMPLKQIRATMLNSVEFKNSLKTLEKQKGREAAFEQLFEAVFNSPADGKNYKYFVQKNKGMDLQKAKATLMQSKRYQKQNW